MTYWTVRDAMQKLKIGRDTVYSLLRRGELKYHGDTRWIIPATRERVLTPGELARAVGYSRRHIDGFIEKQRITAIKFGPKISRILISEAVKFMRARTEN